MTNPTVTVSEFHARIDRRKEVNPAFKRNIEALLKHNPDWRTWAKHLQQDLFDKLEIGAVLLPIGPGNVIVPDGVVAGPAADSEALVLAIREHLDGWSSATFGWQGDPDPVIAERNKQAAIQAHAAECLRRIRVTLGVPAAETQQEKKHG